MEFEYNNYNTFREKRYQLVQTLKKKGIKDEKLLNALGNLPREMFVEPAYINRAYEDNALPIGFMQTISQPYTVAYMTELLEIEKGDKVLEIGTGSGYQAALLHLMEADVYSVERIEELSEKAAEKFAHLRYNIRSFTGDGTMGLPEYAPFDKLIVTAAAPDLPKPLIMQLKIGGRMVIPVGNKSVQTMRLIIRKDQNNFDDFEKETFKFVPLIGEEGWDEI